MHDMNYCWTQRCFEELACGIREMHDVRFMEKKW